MAKKIIVIGSGFGGLAAALRLKAKGFKVTLLEKHPDLGGRARVFKKDQFIYDGGPTVITAPYLFEELLGLHYYLSLSVYIQDKKLMLINLLLKEVLIVLLTQDTSDYSPFFLYAYIVKIIKAAHKPNHWMA